ncbi:hypothetical protein GQ457_09G007610 [Hibiscus cannabinus]
MADRTSTPSQEAQTTFTRLHNSIDRMFNEVQVKFLTDAKLLLEKAFGKSIDFPVAISQSWEESDKSSLVIDFAEPMVQVSAMEASLVAGLSDSTRNLMWQSKTESLISDGCGEPNGGLSKPTLVPFAEPKLESWVTVSNEDKVFHRLPMTMDEESDDLADSTKTLLERPLVQGVASTKYVETEQELLMICSNEVKVFDELLVITYMELDSYDDLKRNLLESTIECVDKRCRTAVE